MRSYQSILHCLLLTVTGHGVVFVAGAVTEVAFGVISSSMPALNHIIVVTIPGAFSSLGGSTRGLPTTSGNGRSFKDSFRNYRGENIGGIQRTDTLDVYEDDLGLQSHDTPYGENHDVKHTNTRYPERDLESDPGGKIYYSRFKPSFSHYKFRREKNY